MKRMRSVFSIVVVLVLTFANSVANGQIYDGEKLEPDSTTFENIYVKPIYSDSLSSTYAIWIKKSVKAHKHKRHTEVVTVLQGKGVMTFDGEDRKIKKGDVIVIPKGTSHAVVTTSRKALLVISVQAPQFLGKDRVWLDKKIE